MKVFTKLKVIIILYFLNIFVCTITHMVGRDEAKFKNGRIGQKNDGNDPWLSLKSRFREL